jgi:hypothetical protein
MSKSTPSTSTTVQSNPLGQLQGQFLGGMWQSANAMSGSGNPQNAYGWPLLQGIQDYAQNNYNNTAGQALQSVPAGLNFVNNALTGNANPYLPANQQTQALGGIGQGAVDTGLGYGNALSNAAYGAPGSVSPYQSALAGLAGQYGGLTNAGYNTYGAMNSLGGMAGGAAPGALSQFGGLSGGALNVGNPSEQQLMANSGMAISGNPAYGSLGALASGALLNPNANPYLQGSIKTATDPIVKQYMTATAPQTSSAFEGSGRYGSGVAANAQGQNQYGLGQALQNASSNIVNNAYNTGLQTTLGAAGTLGNTYNTGMSNSNAALANAGQLGQSGYNLAGNLLGQGYSQYGNLLGQAGSLYSGGAGALNSLGGTGLGGASANYNNAGQLGLGGWNSLISGLSGAAGAANAGYGTGANAYAQGGNLANAGTLNMGGLAQMTPDLANYPMSQLSTAFNTAWAPLQNYASLLGQPIGGNTTTQQTTPYYSNTASNILGGALGIAQLASKI